jgi:hypothetical protein
VSIPAIVILSTLKYEPAGYHDCVKAKKTVESQATACCEPWPNSILPSPIVTLAARDVTNNGAVTKIMRPSAIFFTLPVDRSQKLNCPRRPWRELTRPSNGECKKLFTVFPSWQKSTDTFIKRFLAKYHNAKRLDATDWVGKPTL